MKKTLLLSSVIIGCMPLFSQTEKTVFLNTGKMYVGEIPSNKQCALYIDRSFTATNESSIQQNGHTVLNGNFHNEVSSGNVFATGTATGKFEFKGDKVQYIKSKANKALNFINFPELIINNQTVVNTATDTAAVIAAPNVALTTQNLSLYRGRLILDSEPIMNGSTDTRSSNVAHLLVNGTVSYDVLLGTYAPELDDKNDRGIIQAKLAIGDHYKNGYLIGFTPPFQTIYNDYFFYNFISKPSAKGLFGDSGMLIADPKFRLESGKGYILGFGVVPENDPYYQDHWGAEWAGTSYDDRFKDMMSFARDFAPSNLAKFVNEDPAITDQYTGEKINENDVPVMLEEGWNFIGNPYTSPISLSTFLDEATVVDQWGVTRGTGAPAEVENMFYILTQGFSTYYPQHTYNKFQFDVTYLVAQKVGNTITLDGNAYDGLIAPMQLFVIQKNTQGTKDLIIPKAVRTHGDVKFLRSGHESSTVPVDELLIETKDMKTGGYDRLCIVFRDNATAVSNDPYDAEKLFNSSGGVNQIYTQSLDNKKMTTNVISPDEESITMYLQPSETEQTITLTAHRLGSLISVDRVILEDTQNGTETDLLENPSYSFRSAPSDKYDRFVLHFQIRGGEGIDDNEDGDNQVNAFYHSGTVTIARLKTYHIGANVSIFAMNGQVCYEGKIANTPTEQMQIQLPQGTYLIKIGNEKSAVTRKMLVR